MKYKHIGSTGNLVVFGEPFDISVHYYLCTISKNSELTWARVDNTSITFQSLKPYSIEITNEEYATHVKLAQKILIRQYIAQVKNEQNKKTS